MSKDNSFSAQIDAWVAEVPERILAVTRQSIQDVVKDATTSRPEGRMPVLTGFLRWTGKASLSSLPSGPNENPEQIIYSSPDNYTKEGSFSLSIAQLKMGDTFYFGWTAVYAARQNNLTGFMDGAVQNWQSYVNKNAKSAMERFGK